MYQLPWLKYDSTGRCVGAHRILNYLTRNNVWALPSFCLWVCHHNNYHDFDETESWLEPGWKVSIFHSMEIVKISHIFAFVCKGGTNKQTSLSILVKINFNLFSNCANFDVFQNLRGWSGCHFGEDKRLVIFFAHKHVGRKFSYKNIIVLGIHF